ncbi:hypothetical protein Q75_01190 [Bacillus coahuilensis p1.1.43]|uniref:Photolyase/cryptochrome alpha/beta domain-containing protein n=1 Tax=Bacillus coahuilensis p1.1.43 TaxID=1150625 RepID=A0A147KBZ7_9BACI|nr:FAD-binding domain-containing protein [Bacillus coahuilensis]KUP09090.1 hypothetical protein Q75_01190 [Bacillus coahuilensis p1.1.43]
MNIVWLKRDIRLQDHRPLYEASLRGETLVVYVVEPSIWKDEPLSMRHLHFILESLEEMQNSFNSIGGKLAVFHGEMIDALSLLYTQYGPFRLWSHKEYGPKALLERNKIVKDWMEKNGLHWTEYQATAISQKSSSIKQFKKEWQVFMDEPVLPKPIRIQAPDKLPSSFIKDLAGYKKKSQGIKGEPIRFGQQGGELLAWDTLQTFLDERFVHYETNQMNPLASSISGSRLSPYLAFGNISSRDVYQTVLSSKQKGESHSLEQLDLFLSRILRRDFLHQRLIENPTLHQYSLHPLFDGVRLNLSSKEYNRILQGETGIPIVDAGVRSLKLTGWLNESTRKMIVMFMCQTMRQSWQKVAFDLGSLFLDYDPGIHYSEIQWQAGTWGSKPPRVVNPIKIGKEQDPNGEFVKRYVQELKTVPVEYIHEPWKYPGVFSLQYPAPIVDVVKVNKESRRKFKEIKAAQTLEKQDDQGKEQDQQQLSFDL